MSNIKPIILVGLLGALAYLTLTKSGKEFARKLGGNIVDLSQSGINFIRGQEGFSSTSYKDATGQSIGYGHFIKPGESFPATITEAQGRVLLSQDTALANAAVKNSVKVPLTQDQHDALVSLTYNIGVTAFRNSTLLKKLNASDYAGAAAQFSVWNKSRDPHNNLVVNTSLVSRRAQEKELFLSA